MSKTVQHVRSSVIFVACIFSIISFCGCASMSPMALEANGGALQLTSKSTGLFTLRTSNPYKPNYQPNVRTIEMISQDTDKAVNFTVTKPHSQEKKRFLEYLVSVDLTPGIYRVGSVTGTSPYILTFGSFKFPIGASFELPPNSVVYLGHVNMVNRKKTKGEKSSGSMFPLIDQGASGYADGTFDIAVSDRSNIDIQLFEQTYPELSKHLIMKNIMTK